MDSEGEPRKLFFEHSTACLLASSEKFAIYGVVLLLSRSAVLSKTVVVKVFFFLALRLNVSAAVIW
jgi:hypothetical protein